MTFSPTPMEQMVIDRLVAQVPGLGMANADPATIAQGFRLAADRVAEWAQDGNWPKLRDHTA